MADIANSPCSSDTPGLRPHRACRHCVQIKAKCVPLEGFNNSTCQRCHRLGKQCTTPAAVPRKRHRTKSTKVSQLEERIDNLTNLITASRANCQPVPHTSTLPSPPETSSYEGSHLAELGTVLEANYWLKCRQRGASQPDPEASKLFTIQLPPEAEEKLFSDFRSEMSRHFPFVIIPPFATTRLFRQQHPFLFRACIAAACHTDPAMQPLFGEDLLRYLGERMLVKGEKSLDLLQGLLVFVAWFQYYNHFNPQLMNLLHLSMGLAIDLGLNRPSLSGQSQLGVVIDTTSLLHGKAVNQGIQTSDERRALLGVYYVFSKLATSFKRLDPMRFTQHLEDCCQALISAAEYPTDFVLVQHVRLQNVLERYLPQIIGQPVLGVPVRSFVKCFEEDIRKFRQSVPRDLLEKYHLDIHILGGQICLYEIVHMTDCDLPIHRVEAWYTCLNRISEFFDHFTAQPSEYLPNLTFLQWLHVVHVLLVLAKLSFLVADGWDLDFVRTKSNFNTVTDRLIDKLQSVAALDTGNGSRHLSCRFNMYAEKMRMCKRWYDAKIKAEAEAQAYAISAPCADGTVPTQSVPEVTFGGIFEGFDDGIWQDFMHDWTGPMQF